MSSDLKDNGALAVLVTKATDYPEYMRSRWKSPNIRRYLPFSELNNLERNLGESNNDIVKSLKSHSKRYAILFFNRYFLCISRRTTCKTTGFL